MEFRKRSSDEAIKEVNASKVKVESAVMKALNKTALWLKVQASKEISQEKQIKLSLISCTVPGYDGMD